MLGPVKTNTNKKWRGASLPVRIRQSSGSVLLVLDGSDTGTECISIF